MAGLGSPKGRVNNPKGRTKGARGKATILKEGVLKRILHGKKTPLEFLLATMMGEDVPFGIRIDAAKAAAPYVHKRMPISVEQHGEMNHNHQVKGGVMLVPMMGSTDDWGKRAAAAQAALKEDVKK